MPPKLLPQLADAEAVVAPRADPARPDRVGADPQFARRRARPRARRARDEFRAVGQRGPQPLERAPRHRRVDRGFPPRRAAVPRAGRQERSRINCGLATSFGCTIEGDVDEDRVRRIANEVAEAGADGIILADTVGYGQPAAIGRVFRKIIADVAPLPVVRAFPRHARARPRQCAGRLRGRVPRVRRLARRARRLPLCAGRDRQHRARRHRVHVRGDGVRRPASISSAWRRCARWWPRRCPAVTMYGAIAKAGLPRNFHPVAQAA